MFWGLIMEPKRRYTQVVKRPFHVSMAALDIYSSNNEPCQVILNFEDRNYLLCTLQKGKDTQCVLDLNFEAGNKVIFATNGDSNVHLTGYLVEDLDELVEEQEEEEEEDITIGGRKKRKMRIENQPPKKKSKTEQLLDEADNYDSNDDESFSLSKAGEEDSSDESSDEQDENDASDDEEEDDDDDEEEDGADDDDEENEDSLEDEDELSSLSDVEEAGVKSKVNGVASKRKQRGQKNNKREQNAQSPNAANKSLKGEKTPTKQENIQKGNKTPKGEKTPKGNKSNANEKNGSAVKTPKEQQAGSPQKRTLEGGLIVQDIVVGNGQVVKSGKLAEVYYEGRLKQNNKVFDKLRQGPAFKFRLGKQEVIKGWDIGVAGMKVGGKRRITCPPNMGYGARGSPPQIPPNSTLIFEVELKNIK